MDLPHFGPTGKFPDGKLDPSDEGELAIGIATDKKNGVIRIHFGKPIAWFALKKDEAMRLSKWIAERAEDLP